MNRNRVFGIFIFLCVLADVFVGAGILLEIIGNVDPYSKSTCSIDKCADEELYFSTVADGNYYYNIAPVDCNKYANSTFITCYVYQDTLYLEDSFEPSMTEIVIGAICLCTGLGLCLFMCIWCYTYKEELR